MPMTDDQRKEAARDLARAIYGAKTADMDADDLRAAVDAVDDWIDQQLPGFLAMLPEPFATRTTAAEKRTLFTLISMRRVGLR